MIDEKHYDLSIDQVSDEIGRLLEANHLTSGHTDNRISAIPDMRTIRYYSGLGLVDRPAIVGRVAKYSRRHLLQIMAVKVLQASNLPLAEIQSRLYGLSDGELEKVIAMYVDDVRNRVVPPSGGATTTTTTTTTTTATRGISKRAINVGATKSGAPLLWQEVEIENGLKIMVEQSWLQNLNDSVKVAGQALDPSALQKERAALHKKITAVLDALIGPDPDTSGDLV